MDPETHAEIQTLHGRVTEISMRVVSLEAQQPHIKSSLERIEQSINTLKGHVAKAVWIILALFLTAVFRVAMTGKIPTF